MQQDSPHQPDTEQRRSITPAPLDGVRIIDLSTVLFGPYASQWLADFGADVIKVETPSGDSTRSTGPEREHGMAATHLAVNRSKRSVVLDLKQGAARKALLQVLESADVLMHNIRPQKLAALGLDAQNLRTRFPRLVCVSLTGFLSDGPYGGRPAYDDIIQGMCGLADLVQRQTGETRYLPTVAADKVTGLIAAQAILAAVIARDRSGQGQEVEVPMFECMVNFTLLEHSGARTFVPSQGTAGYARVLSAWRRPYRSLDGHVCLMPYTTEHWNRFFSEVGHPGLVGDSRFIDMKARTAHIDELYTFLATQVALRTTQDWLSTCSRLDIPAGPVTTLEGLADDPHLRATGFFQEIPNGDSSGAIRLAGPGVRFNGQALAMHPPPRLGEHTQQVLREYCVAQKEIDEIVAAGARRAAAF